MWVLRFELDVFEVDNNLVFGRQRIHLNIKFPLRSELSTGNCSKYLFKCGHFDPKSLDSVII